jgi:flagellar protein FlbD
MAQKGGLSAAERRHLPLPKAYRPAFQGCELMVYSIGVDKMRGVLMIRLTRLNRAQLVLNSDLIEHIDVTPDTVITLTNGQILRVRETSEQVIQRIVDFRRKIHGPDGQLEQLCEERGDLESIDHPDRPENLD